MSAATASGTGTMYPLPEDLTTPGIYLRWRPGGVTAWITTSPDTLRAVRRLTASVLAVRGVGRDAVDAAELVVSELVGNAVRALGAHVPLVVEAYLADGVITVAVHDPAPDLLPQRSTTEPDSDQAESGRGLPLLDLIAPGWTVERSPLSKVICCRLAT